MKRNIENIIHLLVVLAPSMLLFFWDGSHAFISSLVVITTAVASSYLLAKDAKKNRILEAAISHDKVIGMRQAYEVCFSKFWLIPKRSFPNVSDSLWSLSTKRYQLTTRAALIASDDFLYLIYALMGIVGLYAGSFGEFGYVYDKLSNLIGMNFLKALVVGASSWLVFVSIFNWFYRRFALGGNK